MRIYPGSLFKGKSGQPGLAGGCSRQEAERWVPGAQFLSLLVSSGPSSRMALPTLSVGLLCFVKHFYENTLKDTKVCFYGDSKSG